MFASQGSRGPVFQKEMGELTVQPLPSVNVNVNIVFIAQVLVGPSIKLDKEITSVEITWL